MILTSDYHTHTKFSHGKGSVKENAIRAKELGLKEIAISDHGFSHPAFGLRKWKLPRLIDDCKEAEKETGVRVLVGIESNIIGIDGTVDLKANRYDDFDVFLAGIHKFVLYKPNTFFKVFIPNFFNSTFNSKKVSNRLIKENTKAFINVIKNNPVDVITHLNYCCYANSLEVAKAASDYGTYIELNSKKTHLTDEEIADILAKTDAKFIINSDAHSPNRVGEVGLAFDTVSRLNIHIDGKLPDFRFKKFKESNDL